MHKTAKQVLAELMTPQAVAQRDINRAKRALVSAQIEADLRRVDMSPRRPGDGYTSCLCEGSHRFNCEAG